MSHEPVDLPTLLSRFLQRLVAAAKEKEEMVRLSRTNGGENGNNVSHEPSEVLVYMLDKYGVPFGPSQYVWTLYGSTGMWVAPLETSALLSYPSYFKAMKESYDELEQCPEMSEIVSLVQVKYSVSQTEAKLVLALLVLKMATIPEETKREESITGLVVQFVSHFEGTPSEWHVVSWLEGLLIRRGCMELSNGITLRCPSESETGNLGTTVTAYPGTLVGIEKPSSVLEFRMRAKGIEELQKRLDTILNALSLYKVGSVDMLRVSYEPDSFMGIGKVTGRISQGKPYQYALSEGERNLLDAFLVRTIRVLTSPELEMNSHIGIALQRYRSSLTRSVTEEERVTYAITCLEALLLGSKERDDLSRKLAQRLSILLSCLGYDSEVVLNNTMSAYDVRSQFIHGGTPHVDAKLCHTILQYSRVSIMIFLQTIKQAKEKLIRYADLALIKEEYKGRLKNLLSDVITNITATFPDDRSGESASGSSPSDTDLP